MIKGSVASLPIVTSAAAAPTLSENSALRRDGDDSPIPKRRVSRPDRASALTIGPRPPHPHAPSPVRRRYRPDAIHGAKRGKGRAG